MSTSRSRLTRSIQEIAKRDPDLRRAIEATKPRGDQPSAAGVGTSDAERDRICCDGTVSGDANPGTEERDTSEGGQDGLNPDDTADISDMGPGSLTGLHDCATGEPVCFDGADWVPPEGWDSPTNPGDAYVEWYDPGYYYITGTTSGAEYGVTATEAAVNGGGQFVTPCGECDSGVIGCISPDAVGQRGTRVGDNISCGNEIRKLECGGSSAWYCNPDPDDYLQTEWPSDSCVNLVIRGGSIVGSKYDPENDGTYSKPMSEIELCDDFGNSFYLSPSAGGGWKTINATKDAGYLWGSNGQKIAHIDGNEYSDPSI